MGFQIFVSLYSELNFSFNMKTHLIIIINLLYVRNFIVLLAGPDISSNMFIVWLLSLVWNHFSKFFRHIRTFDWFQNQIFYVDQSESQILKIIWNHALARISIPNADFNSSVVIGLILRRIHTFSLYSHIRLFV